MGSVASYDDSVFISHGFRSCLYSLDSEELCVKAGQSSLDNSKKDVNGVNLEDLESSTSDEDDLNDSMVKDLVNSLSETLHIHDVTGPLGARNPTLNQENICKQMEVKPVSFNTGVPEGVNKCASILCSELVQSNLVRSDADGLLCNTDINENDSKVQNLAFGQPLHAARKLIPALKGSRALYGKHMGTKLSVKWAPDVYDPPVTSTSHTVKGSHRHHAKTTKDYHNHKYGKGKSYRSTCTIAERKHTTLRRSNLTDPRISRLQALGCERATWKSCDQSKIDSLDSAVRSDGDGFRYGSSLYMESLASVRLPAARAS